MNRTTERTIKMLEVISKQKTGINLKEIVDQMKIPKSSAFDILHSLIDLNVVSEKEGSEKKYIIGVKAFEIGSAFMLDVDLISKAKYDLEELAEKLNKTAFIGVLDGEQVVYIYKHQASRAKLTASNVGSRNDVYSTSLGKAIVAHLDKEKQKQIIEKLKFEPKTENTITTKEKFIEELEETYRRGYAIDNREVESHMICFGAPIYDYSGKVIASISISDLYRNEIDYEYQGQLVKETAERISNKLGNIR